MFYWELWHCAVKKVNVGITSQESLQRENLFETGSKKLFMTRQ